jgi:hypothetical protein
MIPTECRLFTANYDAIVSSANNNSSSAPFALDSSTSKIFDSVNRDMDIPSFFDADARLLTQSPVTSDSSLSPELPLRKRRRREIRIESPSSTIENAREPTSLNASTALDVSEFSASTPAFAESSILPHVSYPTTVSSVSANPALPTRSRLLPHLEMKLPVVLFRGPIRLKKTDRSVTLNSEDDDESLDLNEDCDAKSENSDEYGGSFIDDSGADPPFDLNDDSENDDDQENANHDPDEDYYDDDDSQYDDNNEDDDNSVNVTDAVDVDNKENDDNVNDVEPYSVIYDTDEVIVIDDD